jgi:hypothetical protein
MPRRIPISEARRTLPQLVKSIAAGGGRVDITYRGKPQVSLLRVSDVRRAAHPVGLDDPALRVTLSFPAEQLAAELHAQRQKHEPRTGWLGTPLRTPRAPKRRARGGAR